MAISMNLWSIDEKKSLNLIPKSKIELESQLEDWIIDDPTTLDLDFIILGRQVHTDHGGYIDILGMNREGDLIIVELKRNKTPRDVVAQCLDYASWVSDLNYGKITEIHKKYTGKNIEEEYQSAFDDHLPEKLNENHQIVIVGASLDDATERIIQYLADKQSMNINAIFFTIFELDGKQILGRSWLKDPEIVEEKSSKGKRPPWTGYLFVNTGIRDEGPRDWKLNIKYSYVSAGNSIRWINLIRKLKPGDKIFAYIKGKGYVGYGTVEEEAVPVNKYETNGMKLINELPEGHAWKNQVPTQKTGEWLTKVKWIKTFPKDQAKKLKHGFANQNVVCKLRDKRTFDFLVGEFGVEEDE